MEVVILWRERTAGVGCDLIAADLAPINPGMWRYFPWVVLTIEIGRVVVREVLTIFVKNHVIP